MQEAFLINPVQHRRKRTTINPKLKAGKRTRNPLGEEILVIGGNPKVKKNTKKSTRRPAASRTTASRTTASRTTTRGPAASRTTALSPADKQRKRRKRTTVTVMNKPKKRLRRNPAMLAVPNIKKPFTFFMPLLIGMGGAIASDQVPVALGLTGSSAPAAQLGVIFGGGLLINGFLGPIGATCWVVGSSVSLLRGLVTRLTSGLTATGISEIPYPSNPSIAYESGLDAFPAAEDYTLDAFPGDIVG